MRNKDTILLENAYLQVVNEERERDVRIYDVKRRATKHDLAPYIHQHDQKYFELNELKGAWIVFIQEDFDKDECLVVEYKTPFTEARGHEGPKEYKFKIFHTKTEDVGMGDFKVHVILDGYASEDGSIANAIKEWEASH
jgi:predicted small secreted protein